MSASQIELCAFEVLYWQPFSQKERGCATAAGAMETPQTPASYNGNEERGSIAFLFWQCLRAYWAWLSGYLCWVTLLLHRPHRQYDAAAPHLNHHAPAAELHVNHSRHKV